MKILNLLLVLLLIMNTSCSTSNSDEASSESAEKVVQSAEKDSLQAEKDPSQTDKEQTIANELTDQEQYTAQIDGKLKDLKVKSKSYSIADGRGHVEFKEYYDGWALVKRSRLKTLGADRYSDNFYYRDGALTFSSHQVTENENITSAVEPIIISESQRYTFWEEGNMVKMKEKNNQVTLTGKEDPLTYKTGFDKKELKERPVTEKAGEQVHYLEDLISSEINKKGGITVYFKGLSRESYGSYLNYIDPFGEEGKLLLTIYEKNDTFIERILQSGEELKGKRIRLAYEILTEGEGLQRFKEYLDGYVIENNFLPYVFAEIQDPETAAENGGPGIYEFTCGGLDSKLKASSRLAASDSISYQAENLSDHDKNTVWAEGKEGYGEKEWVEFNFNSIEDADGRTVYGAFLIINGYAKSEDLWIQNSRVKRLLCSFNGKPVCYILLNDTSEPQEFSIGEYVKEFGKGNVIRFQINSVQPGLKYTDTVISEFVPLCAS